MGKALDLTGVVVGRLTALRPDTSRKIRHWVCLCECGKETSIPTAAIRNSSTRSCGCLLSDTSSKKVIDLTGQTFGRLTVTSRISARGDRRTKWECLCSCGRKTVSVADNLRSGRSQSCGCLRAEATTKHGNARKSGNTSEYGTWEGMNARCFNEKSNGFRHYGGRGITVCDRWRESFENFIADMGPKPTPKHSIDRFPDMNGNYEPSNCRWATPSEQSRNTRVNHVVSYQGESLPLIEWAERYGLAYSCLHSRLKSGWSVERALNETPKGKQ